MLTPQDYLAFMLILFNQFYHCLPAGKLGAKLGLWVQVDFFAQDQSQEQHCQSPSHADIDSAAAEVVAGEEG